MKVVNLEPNNLKPQWVVLMLLFSLNAPNYTVENGNKIFRL